MNINIPKQDKLSQELMNKLIADVKSLLNDITDTKCIVEPLKFEPNPSILISLPARDVFESRWIMQAFNTPIYRARRKPRDKSKIEVSYRKY